MMRRSRYCARSHWRGRIRALLLATAAVCACGLARAGEVPDGWVITQTATGLSFNTRTGIATRKTSAQKGLVSVSTVGAFTQSQFWEPGAFRPTITLDDSKLVDGLELDDVSRLRSIRLDRSGSHVYLRSRKGPETTVDLVHDGKVVIQWPRRTHASIIFFDADQLVLSVQDKESLDYVFSRIPRTKYGRLVAADHVEIGRLKGCALLSAKSLDVGLALQVFCDEERGSDVYLLPEGEREPIPIADSDQDEILAFGLDRSIQDDIPVLAVSGSRDARQAFHAISGLLLTGLGEPGAVASDGAGYQSWSQSYRTEALVVLYEKTEHGVFAALARRAMRGTLSATNAHLNVSGADNPRCGWASRIYSEDHRTPVSLMVNQAVIIGSLVRACQKLGNACSTDLRQRIYTTAVCAVRAQEKNFDTASGLYRIPYGINFRYDGVWAPWNWQMAWANVLRHVAQVADKPAWDRRAARLVDQFLKSWELEKDGALWRYWPPAYFAGWTEEDLISASRPVKRADADPNYEDIAHAGISLRALAQIRLSRKQDSAVRQRLDTLLQSGFMLPTFIDGSGTASPRWFPATGWDAFATDELRDRYAALLPSATSGARLLAYANLYRPEDPFRLDLELLSCGVSGCTNAKAWHFDSIDDYLDKSPLFSIMRVD
ncbi:MAG: hypothetical protein WBQ77_09465 [Methyloceanibacter sp.]|uniref:hypothetical protein n=1 Tax=Methyloceanibacter sp. TaxID=1965321 RepID=UPI003C3163A6